MCKVARISQIEFFIMKLEISKLVASNSIEILGQLYFIILIYTFLCFIKNDIKRCYIPEI